MKTKAVLFLCALLAGAFNQIQALPSDVDLSFDPGSGVNGYVRAIVIQPDGKLLIAGDFTTMHATLSTALARLNADGSVDTTFAATIEGPVIGSYDQNTPSVFAVALQPDGKLLIGGTFATVGGLERENLARLNSDGSLDESFPGGGIVSSNVDKIFLLDNGKILVQTRYLSGNGVARTNLARLNPDGSVDATFLANVSGAVVSTALQSDGKILIGGQFTGVDGIAHTNLARLNSDGILDPSFTGSVGPFYGVGVHSEPTSFALQNDGKIVIAGYFSTVNDLPIGRIARLNPDGTLDPSFGANIVSGPGRRPVVALQSDGRILVGGHVYITENQASRAGCFRLNTDGTLDQSFYTGIEPLNEYPVLCIVPHGQDGILVGGGFKIIHAGTVFRNFCQLNYDGSPDLDFSTEPTGPEDTVFSLAVQADGRVLVGGSFRSIDSLPRGRICRLLTDGSLDLSFLDELAGADSEVDSIAVQNDGKILMAGLFSNVNGVARGKIARLNADGTLDTSFANGLAGANAQVQVVTLQNDGKILIGGSFTNINGIARARLGRLNTDGTLDSEFLKDLSGPDDTVSSISIQTDGKILIGGSFLGVNGVQHFRLARLNTDGTLDNSFRPSVGGSVYSIVQQTDGKILVAGAFQIVNDDSRKNLARLNANGTLDTTFSKNYSGPQWSVASVALQKDGKLLIGGNGIAQKNLARLNSNGTLDETFTITTTGANQDQGRVNAILLQPDAKILICGEFTVVNQTPRSHVARLMGEFIPLGIITPPQSQTAEVGAAASFSVTVVGYPPPSYQWFFNETTVLGPATTNRMLRLSDVQFSQSGLYSVVVLNSSGSVTSSPASLNVIAPVERKSIPAVQLFGDPGSLLHVEYTHSLDFPHWQTLADVTLTSVPAYYFDLPESFPAQRFIRVRQVSPVTLSPDCKINLLPALTLTGVIGQSVRVDYINQIGPIDAWVTLENVTLTNSSQLYFDISAPGRPPRLYRLVALP